MGEPAGGDLEQAAKCLKIASAAYQDGDITKALRFAERAQRLHKTGEAEALLRVLSSNPQPEPRRTTTTASPKAETTAAQRPVVAEKTYTKAQEQLCRKVLAAKDLYGVLDIPKDATEEQVKKAYRKLALQLHPDKNQAPAAEEAFKRISKSFQTLSNEDLRRTYDQTGDEDRVTQNQAGPGNGYGMTPDELFQAFFQGFGPAFGGGPFGQRTYVYRTMPRRQQPAGPPPTQGQRRVQNFLQFLPILLFLLFSLFGNSIWSDDRSSGHHHYRLSRTDQCSKYQTTAEHQVPFYVTPSFAQSHGEKSEEWQAVEKEIEYAYFKQSCFVEHAELRRDLEYYRSMNHRKKARQVLEKLQSAQDNSKVCQIAAKLQGDYKAIAKRVDDGRSTVGEIKEYRRLRRTSGW